MANTYTQIHIHFVFVVKYREAMIHTLWKERLHQYITGIVRSCEHKMLIINSMPDHIHMLVGCRPAQSISDLMKNVKAGSSEWINEEKLSKRKFNWQDGYGAFSYAKSDLPTIIKYIENQERHHKKKTFEEEYHKLLKEFEVEFDERYLFHDPQ
jgi:REP element-mobilizing transposase RayT